MSAPGKASKQGTAHSNIQTAQSHLALCNRTYKYQPIDRIIICVSNDTHNLCVSLDAHNFMCIIRYT